MEVGVMEALPENEQKPEIQEDAQSVEMELADEAVDRTGVVKITNISPGVNVEQMKILFGFLGNILELALYPMDENVPVNSKTCYVKYEDKASCDVAQHLTNTVFVDRPLVVVPVADGVIPDEGTALQPKIQQTNGLFGNGEMDDPFSADPFSQFMGNLSVGNNLPPPPVLGNIDPVKIEEIRRTIYVGNLDDSVGPEMLVAFFSGVGEIKFVRQSQNADGKKYALIEFTDLSVIATALQYTGVIFCGKPLKVTYSKCAIIKPDFEKLEAERKNADRHSRYSSRRRSSSLRRSHSRSRSRDRRRSRRSKTRSPSPSYSRPRRRRSRSPSYSRSRRRRSRSRSYTRSHRRRSRSGSHSRRRRRSRSRSKSRSKEGINKKIPVIQRDRRRRRSYSPSPSRDSKYRNSSSRPAKSSKIKRRSKSRSRSRSGSVEKKKSRSKSPVKERSKRDRSRTKSRSPSRSYSRRKSRRDRRSKSRSRSRDRKTRDKERKRDRRDRSRERSSSRTKKIDSPKKEKTPQYQDVDNVDDNSDMSIEDNYSTKTKSKEKHDYESDDHSDADRKSKKK